MADRTMTGGCHCAAVRYTVQGSPTETYHCHCSVCRKSYGAVFVTFSVFPRNAFSIDEGEDNVVTYDTPNAHRRFCRTCGCHVVEVPRDGAEEVYVPAATLDGGAYPGHPEGAIKHVFVGSRVPWYEIADDLPRHEEF